MIESRLNSLSSRAFGVSQGGGQIIYSALEELGAKCSEGINNVAQRNTFVLWIISKEGVFSGGMGKWKKLRDKKKKPSHAKTHIFSNDEGIFLWAEIVGGRISLFFWGAFGFSLFLNVMIMCFDGFYCSQKKRFIAPLSLSSSNWVWKELYCVTFALRVTCASAFVICLSRVETCEKIECLKNESIYLRISWRFQLKK